MNATPTDPIAFQGLIRFDPMLALSFLDISTRWGMLGLICLLAAILSISFFFLLPYASTRFLSLLLGKSLFRLRVKDAHHVPATGPVLLIGNPASYMGWLWFLAASPRKIRFVLLGGWTSLGINGWLLRRANAITLAGNTPADFAEVFRKARAALGQGEAVCIFSEGCKADGVNPHYLSDIFREIAENQSVPVLPVCLHQPDGSMFLLRGGKFLRRWPPETPSSVYVQFGPLLPAGTTVLAARQALQETSAQLAIERNGQSRTVHQRFIRIAAKHPFKVCWIDSSAPGQSMTYAAAYAGSRCLAGLLAEFLAPDEERVGIWLPPGRGSAMTNIALAFLGKTSVNLNYSGPVDSAHAALKQCSCRHVLTSKRFLDRVPFQPPEGVKLVPLEDLLPKLRRSRKLLAFLSAVLLPGWFIDRFVLKTHRHRLDSLATIIFSSGSTGEPKGVMLTHGNITANVQSMVQAINIGPEDRLLGV
ncbi:MAG: AMP-binding protein, partial [Gemmataceae bacterium]